MINEYRLTVGLLKQRGNAEEGEFPAGVMERAMRIAMLSWESRHSIWTGGVRVHVTELFEVAELEHKQASS